MEENKNSRTIKSHHWGENTGVFLNRKEFINKFARYGIVGLFILLGGFLLIKRKVTLESNCTNNFACKNCNKFKNCTLPEKS